MHIGSEMQRFTQAIEKSLEEENWYAALSLALALPDICANVCSPNEGSQKRYVKWYNQFMLSKYTRGIGPDKKEHIFLTGADCYALRCALLHEGSHDIKEQRAQEVIEHFNFVVPPNGWTVHMNQSGNALQLQVDVFCQDICASVNQWLAENSFSNGEFDSFLTITDINGQPIA
jgi:hypothetical protein